jgi:hypothetical protein
MGRMPRRPFAFFILLLLVASGPRAFAQAPAPSEPATQPAAEPPTERPDLLRATLPLDIAVADYQALGLWLRSLGLSEDGDAAARRARLYAHYRVEPYASAVSPRRIVTIESAERTSYEPSRDEAGERGSGLIRLEGGVSLVIRDDESGETIRLQADEVSFDADAGLLFARGKVQFERQKPDGAEFFNGRLLELDLNDRSGLFIDGASSRGEGDDRVSFRARDIASRGGGVLVLKDGLVSSSDAEHPNYSIRASTIWILGGNEWAMSNATLYVGEVPVLWLPFFYYPGEEIVFHPVFGYDDRLGRFVQTTTYFLGEKAPKSESISLFRLSESGGPGYERELRGVFLRKTDQRRERPAGGDFVKVMADIYTNLGYYGGIEAKFASLGVFSQLTGYLGLGISRSLFRQLPSGVFTPFDKASDYRSVWNESAFLGLGLPFRFGAELAGRAEFGAARLSFNLPLYSDPYFDQDFRKRSEDMDWLAFMKPDLKTEAPSLRSGFVDRVEASWSAPRAMLPGFLDSLSLSRLSSSLSWASKARGPVPAVGSDEYRLYEVDPSRRFFYPDSLVLADFAASAGGTLYDSSASARGAVAGSSSRAASPSAPRLELTPPWAPGVSVAQDQRGAGGGEESTAGSAATTDPVASDPMAAFALPRPLSPPAESAAKADAFSLRWQLSPSGRWDRRFKSSAWDAPKDVDWEPLFELYNLRLAGNVTANASMFEGLLGARLALNGTTQIQERPVANEPSLETAWRLQDAQFRADRLGGTAELTLSPFVDSWLLSATTIRYSLDAALYDYSFQSMQPEGPVYATKTPAWDGDRIRSHALRLNLAARPYGLNQRLSFEASIPPTLESYGAALELDAGFASFGLQTKYAEPSKGAPLRWSPLNARLSLGLAPWPLVTSQLVWDLEAEEALSLNNRLSWRSWSADLNWRKAVPFEYVVGTGWVAGTEAFRPAELQFSVREEWKPPPSWKNRLSWSLGLGASARQSFLRFTDSSMDVTASFNFSVHRFLDLSFQASSRNSSLWRYYPGLFDLPNGLVFEPVDPLTDILRSFNFFDRSEREQALFKLKSLSLKAVHKLDDWDLSLDLGLQPVLKDGRYEFMTSVTLLLAWRGVPEIKSGYTLKDGVETWE